MGVRHDPDNQNELHHRESFEAESMKPDDARYQSVDPPEGRHANAAPLGLGSNKIAGFGGFSIDQGLRPWLLNFGPVGPGTCPQVCMCRSMTQRLGPGTWDLGPGSWVLGHGFWVWDENSGTKE